ncbi:MAG: hypothetical protein HY903_03420 [Deltaproteobacteria bacterium]|nr:hypothetical protein [Deltaproteobacteria bacterium]
MIRNCRPLILGVTLLGVGALSSACASYTLSLKSARPASGKVSDEKVAHLLWGMGEQSVDLDKICPQGVTNITAQRSGGDTMVGSFTGGIYQPMTVKISCAGGSAQLTPPVEDERPVEKVALTEEAHAPSKRKTSSRR